MPSLCSCLAIAGNAGFLILPEGHKILCPNLMGFEIQNNFIAS